MAMRSDPAGRQATPSSISSPFSAMLAPSVLVTPNPSPAKIPGSVRLCRSLLPTPIDQITG